jgi:hypothetical protein
MSKTRKRYRPRGVNPLAHLVAMQGASKLTRDDVLAFAEDVYAAVDAARTGAADKGDWQTLFNAINLMEEMVHMRLAKDESGMVDAMQDTVVEILNRSRLRGTKALLPAELQMLRDLAANYTDLLSELTHQQLFMAQERVANRLQLILSTGQRKTHEDRA